MTEFMRRSLEIVRDNGPIRGREFAAFMWPNSDGWSNHQNVGRGGARRGGGMYLCGGSYLGKLARRGLVRMYFGTRFSDYGYVITEKGREFLSAEKAGK